MSPGMMIVPAFAPRRAAVASSPDDEQLATSPATSAVTGSGVGVGVAACVGVGDAASRDRVAAAGGRRRHGNDDREGAAAAGRVAGHAGGRAIPGELTARA